MRDRQLSEFKKNCFNRKFLLGIYFKFYMY